ncbi:GAF domain-containing protein [Chitinimonas koreensis]|uniref:GAF domain-containing protein n=1 Tax=Chitinimonas koreensis TaxID=356302 RepID=UPI00041FF1FD|nr:GAF domain-containing protein [Chitinimonas koreensis]QNM97939.1 GAF domain-containing protein [Chitinimonas koreensis]
MHDTNLLKNLFGLLSEGKLDRSKFFSMLARAVVQEMGASRASFWFFQGALQDSLVCESLYDVSDGQWSSGIALSEDDFPDYFAALRELKLVMATDARHQAATAAFNESYLEPLNIYSLLDVTVEVGGSQLGVVRCEQTVGTREWSQADMQYLQQVAAMVGLALKKFG